MKLITLHDTRTATTTTTTLQLQLQLRFNYTSTTTLQLQLQLHFNYATTTTTTSTTLHFNYTSTTATTTTTLQLRYNYSYHYNCNCNYIALRYTTLHQFWVRWPLQPLQRSQPACGPSMDSLCHPCIVTTHPSYSFLSLKFPPPPCAVLLVQYNIDIYIGKPNMNQGSHSRGPCPEFPLLLLKSRLSNRRGIHKRESTRTNSGRAAQIPRGIKGVKSVECDVSETTRIRMDEACRFHSRFSFALETLELHL